MNKNVQNKSRLNLPQSSNGYNMFDILFHIYLFIAFHKYKYTG